MFRGVIDEKIFTCKGLDQCLKNFKNTVGNNALSVSVRGCLQVGVICIDILCGKRFNMCHDDGLAYYKF